MGEKMGGPEILATAKRGSWGQFLVRIATTKYRGDSKARWTVHVSEIVYPGPNVSLYCCLLDTLFKLA